jgi:hypothetical protein
LHSNSVASFAENVKRAERLVVRLRGADRSVVWGDVASIRQVREAAVPMFPTASVGCTTNVCVPSSSPWNDAGELHGAKALPSRRQWKDDGSSAENVKVAERPLVSAAGADATTAVGGRVSTLHV